MLWGIGREYFGRGVDGKPASQHNSGCCVLSVVCISCGCIAVCLQVEGNGLLHGLTVRHFVWSNLNCFTMNSNFPCINFLHMF